MVTTAALFSQREANPNVWVVSNHKGNREVNRIKHELERRATDFVPIFRQPFRQFAKSEQPYHKFSIAPVQALSPNGGIWWCILAKIPQFQFQAFLASLK